MAEYTLLPTQSEQVRTVDDVRGEGAESERCGAEMTDGSMCDRPADDCPYPSHNTEGN